MLELKKILLKDVMAKKPYTLGPGDNLNTAWQTFNSRGVRHLPVCDSDGNLKGLISTRDLYKIVAPKKSMEGECFYCTEDLERYILKVVMTKDVFSLKPDDTLGQAIDAMVRYKFGCIPIVDNGYKLVGIVTQIDVLRKIAALFL